MKEIISVIGITTIFSGGFIGLVIVGPSIFTLFLILYTFLAIIDITLGYYIARKERKVSSVKMQEGTIKKILNAVIIGVIAIVFWHLSYIFQKTDLILCLGTIPLIIVGWFLIIEFTSIGENYKKLKGTTERENKLMSFFLKILGLGFDKTLELTEKEIERKINNLTFDKSNNDRQRNSFKKGF